MKHQPSSHLFASLTILVWASGFALTKIALDFFSSNSIGFLRYAISTILLLPIIIYKKLIQFQRKSQRLSELGDSSYRSVMPGMLQLMN